MTPEQWQLVVDNLRLIGWTLKRMEHPNRQSLLDAEDAGLDGLMAAARKYRPDGGAKFGRFAHLCIFRNVATQRGREARLQKLGLKARIAWSRQMRPTLRLRDHMGEAVDTALAAMSPSERRAVLIRYGMSDQGPMSYAQSTKAIGGTPLRGREAIASGLAKARRALRGGLDCGE